MVRQIRQINSGALGVFSVELSAAPILVFGFSLRVSVVRGTAPALHEEERKKRERNPIYNRFFNKVVVIVFLFTGL